MNHPASFKEIMGPFSAGPEASTAVCVAYGNSTPVRASQTRMVLSPDPETILDPSGENATELMKLSWPRRGGSISMPVLASQTRMVLSSDPETILDPSTGIEMLPPLRGHDGSIRSVAFSPDGSKIISESNDNTIRVWDASIGTELPCAQMAVDHISRSALDGPIVSLKEGWFMNINTGTYLGRLPVGARFYCWEVHGYTCVGWTMEHKLVIIHFPAQ